MSRIRMASLLGALALFVPGSRAQVADFDWTFEYTPFNGWADQQGDSFHVVGPNNGDSAEPPHLAWVSTIAPVDGHVTVRADFQNFDSEWYFDAPIWVIDGTVHFPGVSGDFPPGSYEFAFDVEAGQVFGFGIWSADAALGAGVADFELFSFTPETWIDAGQALDPREWLTIAPPAGLSDFGTSVGALGDLDLDARTDIAVGAPASGRVLVYSGADGTLLLELTGGPGFGEVVRGAGDVDADGLPDILVGMPGSDAAGTDAGRVEVRSGASGALLFAVDGDASHAVLGRSVAPAGDVNGDGFADVLAGAPRQWPASAPGYVLLLAGPSGALIQRLDGSSILFGAAVCGLDDADGDGTRDVLVAEPLADSGSGAAVHVLSGATWGTISTATHPWSAGAADLAPLGDVDGDGRPDFAWGHPASHVAAFGYVLLVSGATGATLITLAGGHPFDTLGHAVAGGDFDGDSLPDVAMQSRHGDGDVGRVYVASGATGFATIHELRAGPDDHFGASLAAASQLDGDGAADLAVGAPHGGPGLRLLHALDGRGVPRLSGTGDLAPGSPVTISLQHARRLSRGLLVVGPTRVDLPAKGGVLVPFPSAVIPLVTDGGGTSSLGAHWPPAIPAGFTLWMQAWIQDPDGPAGFSASNGLGGEAP